MKVSRIVSFTALALVFGATADAQIPQRKPGLWEMTMGGSGPGMKMPNMQEQLAQMPPERRAQYEAYMKQRGMSFGANSMTTRYCLTPQDVKEERRRRTASSRGGAASTARARRSRKAPPR